MSRNAESHFAVNPTRIDMSRSRFDRSSSYKTTFNVGQIIPFYVDEVLPGDTFSIDTSKVVRMQTLLTPVMDDIFLDTFISSFRIVLHGVIGSSLWERILSLLGFLPLSMRCLN